MTKQLSSHAHAAKLIRAELKKHNIKARVRSSSYAGGNSVDVDLTNELPATVALVTEFANQFQQGHFDGMTDCYEYSNRRDDLPQVKFVFVNNEHTAELKQEAWDFLRASHAAFADAPATYEEGYNDNYERDWGSTWVHRLLTGALDMPGFWNARKPRTRLEVI